MMTELRSTNTFCNSLHTVAQGIQGRIWTKGTRAFWRYPTPKQHLIAVRYSPNSTLGTTECQEAVWGVVFNSGVKHTNTTMYRY